MIIPPIRQQDNHGSGEFGAPRVGRKHRGIDLACYPGSIVLSDVDGFVSKIGYPYDPSGPKGKYRYIEISTFDGYKVRYFYVDPLVPVGSMIKEGNIIGRSQNLQHIYVGITHHIHLEVIKNGKYINPSDYIEVYP